MDKKLKIWSFIGVFIVFALAALWHFVYDLLPYDVVGAISPVSESPWEHTKLFFIPAIIYYIVLYFIAGRNYPNFLFAHSIALLIMPAFMLILYHIYSMFVEETLAFDLINSFLTVALGAFTGYRLTVSKKDFSKAGYKAAALIIVLAMLFIFVYFTFNPPDCQMFIEKI